MQMATSTQNRSTHPTTVVWSERLESIPHVNRTDPRWNSELHIVFSLWQYGPHECFKISSGEDNMALIRLTKWIMILRCSLLTSAIVKWGSTGLRGLLDSFLDAGRALNAWEARIFVVAEFFAWRIQWALYGWPRDLDSRYTNFQTQTAQNGNAMVSNSTKWINSKNTYLLACSV